MGRTTQFTVNLVTDVTSIMAGTSADWSYEAVDVWVNGTSTGFTWDGSTLDIPGYTIGRVQVESILYLMSGNLSSYLPKDPLNPASDVVLWEDRVMRFPVIATSMKNIESGIISSRISTLAFLYRGGWDELATLESNIVNKPIKIYREGSLLYSGFSDGHAASKGVFTITLGNIDSILDQECTFGDPDYMNRIDINSTNSYYTGSSIPIKFDGQAIPMVFGPRSPWEDLEKAPISKGQIVTLSPPLVLPTAVTEPTRCVGSGVILKVIPTSSTTGILCRTPSFQTLNSNKTSTNNSTTFFWSKTTAMSTVEHPNLMYGQLVSFDDVEANRLQSQSGRFISIFNNFSVYQLAREDTVSTSVNNYNAVEYDTKSHLCSFNPSNNGISDANITIGSTTITHGTQSNKLWTISATGLDFTLNEYFYVCTDITGSKAAPDVSEFILSSHGLTTDSSFSTLSADITEKASMQIGNDKSIQTVNEALAEINESLLTLIKKPLDGSTYSIQKIEIDPTPTETVTDSEIGSVKVNEISNSTYGVVEYEPLYIRGSRVRDEVYTSQTSQYKSVFGITKTKVINHVLNATNSRFDEMTEFWSAPDKTVGFILLDESISISIGDYIQVDHEDFTGIILVTSVSPKDLGTAISGRQL